MYKKKYIKYKLLCKAKYYWCILKDVWRGSLGEKCPIKMVNKGFTQTCHPVGAASRIRELRSWGPCCHLVHLFFLDNCDNVSCYIHSANWVGNELFFFPRHPRTEIRNRIQMMRIFCLMFFLPKAVNTNVWSIKTVVNLFVCSKFLYWKYCWRDLCVLSSKHNPTYAKLQWV